MTVDGPTVLVSGTERDRVGEIASRLAGQFTVRTTAPSEIGNLPATDVEVVVFADGPLCDPPLELSPSDAAQVVIYQDTDDIDSARQTTFDRVLVEPLLPGDLESTVASLARRVRYDRRLQECADLAAQCGRAEAMCDGGTVKESRKLRERVDDITAELDGLLAEFSSDDFRQAFQTLAAD